MRTNVYGTIALSALALLGSGYSACDPVIENNGFDLWCGGQLCSWDVEQGSIQRVPTWHEHDYGVELVGAAAAISQVSDATSDDVSCLRFELVADVQETARVTLELDLYDDGIVDHVESIPTSAWAPVRFLVTMPRNYEGVRFRLRKLGTGRARLAQIRAERADKCVDPPIDLVDRPLGARCTLDSECAGGLCAPGVPGVWADEPVCGRCRGDADCDEPGQVCGAAVPSAPYLQFYRACVWSAHAGLGERCAVDAECTTGVCCDAVCSTCCGAGDCADGQACERVELEGDASWWGGPRQCAPGQGTVAAGGACLRDADCGGGVCEGDALRACQLDGRICVADDDCPDDLLCVDVGSARGSCQ